MTRSQIDLELRPAAMSDADMVADLETARIPDDPRDPAMTLFWWTVHPPDQVFMRMLAERSGEAVSIVSDTCPFAGTVSSPVICAVDRGMVKGMLAGLYGDTVSETASSRANGDDTCVTAI